MFACACGQLTSAWEEKPCTDCGHHAYYQDEEEFCEKDRPQKDEKRLQVSESLQLNKIRMKLAREERQKALKVERLKEEEMLAKAMTTKYKNALDEMVKDNGYFGDGEQGHKKKRRNSKNFRKNQKANKNSIEILNIREFHLGKEKVSLILIIKN